MMRALYLGTLALILLSCPKTLCQSAGSSTAGSDGSPAKLTWAYSLTADGYIVPNGTSYASPVLTADRGPIHLEGRYNYENLHTGSVWLGYNLSFGKTVVFNLTPMIGGVFGRTTGVAPGCEASLQYKKLQISVSNEYVFDTGEKSGNFYYSWPELSYSALDWLKVGLVAQRTRAYQTSLDTQRGFLVGVSHKKLQFTTYVFNVGWTDPTIVLEMGYSF
jgi:hypothetical protein